MSEQLTFIPASEAAKIVGVTPETIRNLCKAKTIRFQMRTNLFYVCREDVNKYAESISQVQQIEMDIEKYKAELNQEQKALRHMIEATKERIKGLQVSSNQVERVLQSIPALMDHLTINHDFHISEQSMYILRLLFMGKSPIELSKQFDLTLARIYQIGNDAIKKMALTKTSLEKKDETITELKEQIEQLKIELENEKDPIHDIILQKAKLLITPISSLRLSTRAEKGLLSINVNYVLDLVQCKRNDILKLPNMGKKSIEDIDLFLEVNGLDYEMIIPKRVTLSLLNKYATTSAK